MRNENKEQFEGEFDFNINIETGMSKNTRIQIFSSFGAKSVEL